MNNKNQSHPINLENNFISDFTSFKSLFSDALPLAETMQKIASIKELQNNPICFMLIGPPASGKSTIAQEITKVLPHCNHRDCDSMINARALKENITYHSVILDSKMRDSCVAQFNQSINTALKNRETFIWEQLNVVDSARKIKIYRVKSEVRPENNVFNKPPYVLVGIYTNVPAEIIEERLQQRNDSTRGLPDHKFISPKVLTSVLNEYKMPQAQESFDFLFECDQNFNLKPMPCTPYEQVVKEKKSKNIPSPEEIELRRKEKREKKQMQYSRK